MFSYSCIQSAWLDCEVKPQENNRKCAYTNGFPTLAEGLNTVSLTENGKMFRVKNWWMDVWGSECRAAWSHRLTALLTWGGESLWLKASITEGDKVMHHHVFPGIHIKTDKNQR
jgi:hypothetical protein